MSEPSPPAAAPDAATTTDLGVTAEVPPPQAAVPRPRPTLRATLTDPGQPDGVCSVELEQFEGPLDLLLHLVRRHELDILDIPISFVCEKYLEYIEVMRALDLEVAGDYLVMAATLAYLKSRELVPADPIEEGEETVDEDGQDPRTELISRLLQYQKFRAAADQLDRLPVQGRDTFGRGQQIDLPPVDAGLAPITLYRLAEAYHRVLDRARILKSHEVVLETISVAGRMEQLTIVLIERGRVEFETLFTERTWSSEGELRTMLVVTLMSVLELVRMGVARVHQPEGGAVLTIERAASAAEARQALAEYDEARSYGTRAADSPSEPPHVPEDRAPGDGPPVVEPAVHEAETGVHEAEPGVHEAQPGVHEAQPPPIATPTAEPAKVESLAPDPSTLTDDRHGDD